MIIVGPLQDRWHPPDSRPPTIAPTMVQAASSGGLHGLPIPQFELSSLWTLANLFCQQVHTQAQGLLRRTQTCTMHPYAFACILMHPSASVWHPYASIWIRMHLYTFKTTPRSQFWSMCFAIKMEITKASKWHFNTAPCVEFRCGSNPRSKSDQTI